MRANGSRVIACAMALAMATSITFPVGAFAEIGEPDQLQHEQGSKVTGGGNVADGADAGDNGDSVAANDSAEGLIDDLAGEEDEGSGENQLDTKSSVENKLANTYEVSTNEDLADALAAIAAAEASEATIVLKADVAVSYLPDSGYISAFGVDGKHITVRSEEGALHKLSFAGYCILNGACTFDNVNVTGRRLFCNGYETEFTKNGQIHLSETLYGGGYKTTVGSTHVVIAASGYINPTSTSGLHDVIGGSYKGSVEGDTYLEITGDIKMQGGNHLNPGCMKGDGSSGDGAGVPDLYVGGSATLVYDNKNASCFPAIEGTYGCEMKGDVTLDVRAGGTLGIVGTFDTVDDSIIRGDLHIIAGSQAYENSDRTLRLGGNWPIVGAGHSFATEPGAVGNYAIDGNIVIDAYENVWSWDKGTDPKSYDIPEIYGAIRGTVGGDITINAHGSHVQNIFGASDSVVSGAVTINATDVDLRNSLYGDEDYDEGYVFGLWEKGIPATAEGPVTININGGDVGLVMATDQTAAPAGSSINVTGKPNIRTGIRGTQASRYSSDHPVANISACEATIPFIKMMSQVNVADGSNVIAHIMSNNAGLKVEEGSSLTTDEGQVWIWGDTVVGGTWEQKYSQAANYNDIFVSGNTSVGPKGHLINQGTSNLKGEVANSGVMALMAPAFLRDDYVADRGELRLPAVVSNYDGAGDGGSIPVEIKGVSSGSTTVNTVNQDDWSQLQCPNLGDNYILSQKLDNAAGPAQEVFVLGNADATSKGWYLKRLEDAAGDDTGMFMWQVAKGEEPPAPEPPVNPDPSTPVDPAPGAPIDPSDPDPDNPEQPGDSNGEELSSPSQEEESAVSDAGSSTPQTGDTATVILWPAIAVACAAAGVALLIVSRRRSFGR